MKSATLIIMSLATVVLFGCSKKVAVERPTQHESAGENSTTLSPKADKALLAETDKAASKRWVEEGLRLYQTRDWGNDMQSMVAFEKAVQADPRDAFALAMRGVLKAFNAYNGNIYRQKNDHSTNTMHSIGGPHSNCDPVWNWYEDTTSDPPTYKFGEKGWRYQSSIDRDTLKSAITDVMQATDMQPADERLWVCRGLVYLWYSQLEGSHALEQSLIAFNQALAINSKSADAYYYRAWIRMRMASPMSQFDPEYFLTCLSGLAGFADSSAQPDKTKIEVLNLSTRIVRFDNWQMEMSVDEILHKETASLIRWYQLAADDIKTLLAFKENERIFHVARNTSRLFDAEWSENNPYRYKGNDLISQLSARGGRIQAAYDHIVSEIAKRSPRNYTSKEMFELTKNSVVLIKTPDGSIGSGFFHSDLVSWVITNAHVVDRFQKVQVIFFDGTVIEGSVVRVDRQRDLAAIEVVRPSWMKSVGLAMLRRGDEISLMHGDLHDVPAPGTKVFLIGHPIGMKWTITQGIVSSRPRVNAGVRHGQMDLSALHGTSGGPVLTTDGRLVGVMWGGPAETLNFFISGEELSHFLRTY